MSELSARRLFVGGARADGELHYLLVLSDSDTEMFTRLKSPFSINAPRPAHEAKVHRKEGDEHLQCDRLEAATECYRRAVAIDPDYVEACIGLGFALSEQQQYDEAERHLRHALSLDSRNADVHYLLGTIVNRRNDPAGSVGHFARALEFNPNFVFAYRDLFTALFHSREYEKAKEVLHKAIAACPQSAEFQFHLGNLLRQEGDYDGAISCYENALAIQPTSAESLKHLADVHLKRGQLDQAIAGYQKALWFDPKYVEAHCALGRAMQSSGKSNQAIECYERAVALDPKSAAAQVGLGNAMERLGRLEEAIACYRRAVALEPEMVAALQHLGNAMLARGDNQDAVALYQDVVRLDPGNPARHMMAALSGHKTDRAPRDYVEKLFDEYAQTFDLHLVDVLHYRDHEKLAECLRSHAPSNDTKWDILDLGCGTGLSGAAIASHARQLVGVDLSAKMLEKARERKLYHRMVQQDLLTMMQGEPQSSYDVVMAADVFIYLGKLDELVDEARRLLRPGGLFAFSVESQEALDGGTVAPTEVRDYRLNVTGRYAHSIAYLARMAARAGFAVLSTTDTQSRVDRGKPVQGYLSLWRRLPT